MDARRRRAHLFGESQVANEEPEDLGDVSRVIEQPFALPANASLAS